MVPLTARRLGDGGHSGPIRVD